MAPERKPRLHDEVARADRRWFLAGAVVFAGSLLGVVGARVIYQVTGPHPQLVVFFRRLKRYANSLLRQGRLRK